MEFYRDYKAGKRPKLIIETPPQHGKSVQVIEFISWLAGHDPSSKTIYTSFSEKVRDKGKSKIAKDFLIQTNTNKYFRNTIKYF